MNGQVSILIPGEKKIESKNSSISERRVTNTIFKHEEYSVGFSSSFLGFSFFPFFTRDFPPSPPFLFFLQTFRKSPAQVRVSMVFFCFTSSPVSEALPGLDKSSFKLSIFSPRPQKLVVLHDTWNQHRNAAPLPFLAVWMGKEVRAGKMI